MPGFNTKPFYDAGRVTEDAFGKDLVLAEGGEVRPSTKKEDVESHIDLFWNPKKEGKRECSFDVKGLRKNNRLDESVNADITWLEIQNVKGGLGSLYGKEDYIAFESTDKWLVANRAKLAEALGKKLTDGKIYHYNPGADYKLYQRNGRQDIIVRVPMSFIEECTIKEIPKSNKNDKSTL